MTPLSLPYKRPKKFSDPFHDFSEASLEELLATTDKEMSRIHYQQILGPHLPAGTYEESAYFLPQAFDRLLTHDDDALDLAPSLIWFSSEYAAQLGRDGALAACCERLRACLSQWTADFEVIHFDERGCRKKGWSLQYFDYVRLSESVAEAMCDLVRFAVHADLAMELVVRLAQPSASPVEAAWFLELARQHAADDVYRPPRLPEIKQILEDGDVARRCAEVVTRDLTTFGKFPTYWRDAFNWLGIEHGIDPLAV
jgi:hypothetical protein